MTHTKDADALIADTEKNLACSREEAIISLMYLIGDSGYSIDMNDKSEELSHAS